MIHDREIERGELKGRLLKLWENDGVDREIGLGLYSRNRFPIDTSGFRKWEK